MKTLKKLLFLVPLLFLIFQYGIYGIHGLMGSAENASVASGLGFDAQTTLTIVMLAGVLDSLVALLLLFRPRWWLFLWAGLWVWFPRYLAARAGVENEIIASVLISVSALLAYLAYRKGHRIDVPALIGVKKVS